MAITKGIAGFIPPVLTSSSVPVIAEGRPETMLARMIIEMPLPIPALGDLLTEPHQEHRSRDQRNGSGEYERRPRIHDHALILERGSGSHRLERAQQHGAVARVLCDLAAARFALLSELSERWYDMGRHLHDDRRRDIGHDPEREDR